MFPFVVVSPCALPYCQDLAPALCGEDISVTQYLFGDDFSQSVKNAKQTAQMGREAGKKHTKYWSKNGSGAPWKGKRPWHKGQGQFEANQPTSSSKRTENTTTGKRKQVSVPLLLTKLLN